MGRECSTPAAGEQPQPAVPPPGRRVAVVPYLNARPLICGLDDKPDVTLVRAVPCQLQSKLARGEVEAALLPTIDLQRSDRPPTVIPAGCISSAGVTLTVRIFSQAPARDVRVLWADSDSHTSVVLARVLWADAFNQRLRIIPFDVDRASLPEDAQAVLLIGDKVVTDPPMGYDYQIDLGAMWYEMTALPFVFAVWAAGAQAEHQSLHALLHEACLRGRGQLDAIAREYAPSYGWPVDLARRYLTEHLQFEFTEAHRDGMEEFFDRARECGVLESVRALEYV